VFGALTAKKMQDYLNETTLILQGYLQPLSPAPVSRAIFFNQLGSRLKLLYQFQSRESFVAGGRISDPEARSLRAVGIIDFDIDIPYGRICYP
jgi:hypothetical protein